MPPIASEEHTILVLMDGNERAKRSVTGGYTAGGRKLVELLLHLRDNARVSNVVACVLSRDNITKRSSVFFAEMHEALVEFGAIISSGGLEGVRVKIAGSLFNLRAMGGYAAACADDFESIAHISTRDAAPSLKLTLAVDYGEDIASITGANIILRTGMPAKGVVRTSGIDAICHQRCYGTTALWPQLSMHEVDHCLEIASRRHIPRLTSGFNAEFITSMIRVLSNLATAVDLTVQTHSSAEEMDRALRDLYAADSQVDHNIGAIQIAAHGHEPRHFGRNTNARHVFRIVHNEQDIVPPLPHGFDLIVAPGQHTNGLTLPALPRLGYATVWPSDPLPENIVATLSRAARECFDNPPLHGGERSAASVAEQLPRSSVRPVDMQERAFIERLERWAADSGLWTDSSECPGASNYLRTAFHLFSSPETAEAVAKYMILVAVGDVLFDSAMPDESHDARLHRLRASTTFLRDAIAGERMNPPHVFGSQLLSAIARQWVDLLSQFMSTASDVLLRKWIRALCSHYSGTVNEYEQRVTDNPLLQQLDLNGAHRMRAVETIITHYVPAAPRIIAERLKQLVHRCLDETTMDMPMRLELRVWLYLLDVNTIGAGLAFRTAALTMPPKKITREGILALDATLPLLDYRVRLANDLSGFVSSMGRDRDAGKTNSCALLVPATATGVYRSEALMHATGTIRRVCRTLDDALDIELEKFVRVWPDMGAAIARGRQIGVKAYEGDHYTTMSNDAFTSLLATA